MRIIQDPKSRNLLKISLFVVAMSIAMMWAFYFDITSYEALEIQEADTPFYKFLEFTSASNSYSDRGPIFPYILKIYKLYAKNSIFHLRLLSVFFLGLSGLFILFSFRTAFDEKQKIFAFLMIFSNIYFIQTAVLVKPYAFVFVTFLVNLFFYLKIKHDTKNNYAFLLFGAVCVFSILTFFTNFLIVWILFIDASVTRLKNAFFWLSLVAMLIVTTIKAIMIYKMRFLIRVGGTAFESFGHLDSLQAIQDLFSARSSFQIVNVTFVFCVVGLFVFIFFRNWRSNQLLRLTFIYFIISMASILLLKYFGLREIEARYYFQLLPLIYLLSAKHLNNFVLVSLVLCHVLLNFDYFSEYRHTSIQQAAVYLTQNLRPGETVCTPQLNGYSEKIQQTIESYQNISVIKDLPTSQFFSCRKHFNNREPLPFSRVWIVSFDRLWEPSEKCDGWVGSFDCDENYYKDQLNGYARGNVIELKKPKHRDIFILLYEKF